MLKRRFLCLVLMVALLLPMAPPASANTAGYLVRGVSRIAGSVLQIPKEIVSHSAQVIFPVGLLSGTVTGAAKMVGGILGGTLDVARGAVPLAKYAVFFI